MISIVRVLYRSFSVSPRRGIPTNIKIWKGKCVETFTHQRAHTHGDTDTHADADIETHTHGYSCVYVPVSAPAYMLVVYVRVGLITSVLFRIREVQAMC